MRAVKPEVRIQPQRRPTATRGRRGDREGAASASFPDGQLLLGQRFEELRAHGQTALEPAGTAMLRLGRNRGEAVPRPWRHGPGSSPGRPPRGRRVRRGWSWRSAWWRWTWDNFGDYHLDKAS